MMCNSDATAVVLQEEMIRGSILNVRERKYKSIVYGLRDRGHLCVHYRFSEYNNGCAVDHLFLTGDKP